MTENTKAHLIIGSIFLGFFGMIAIFGYVIANPPAPKYIMVKQGAVNNVEYLSTGGGFLSPRSTTTILHFKDGAVVSVCGHKDVYDLSCVRVYKVQNKFCYNDYIDTCGE